MAKLLTQDVWAQLGLRERQYLTQIHKKRKALESLKEQQSEIHDDIKNAQSLLYIHAIERIKEEGFKEGVEVIYKPHKTTHKITGFWPENESGLVVAMLNPMPKLGVGNYTYVCDLKFAKDKKKLKSKKK